MISATSITKKGFTASLIEVFKSNPKSLSIPIEKHDSNTNIKIEIPRILNLYHAPQA